MDDLDRYVCVLAGSSFFSFQARGLLLPVLPLWDLDLPSEYPESCPPENVLAVEVCESASLVRHGKDLSLYRELGNAVTANLYRAIDVPFWAMKRKVVVGKTFS